MPYGVRLFLCVRPVRVYYTYVLCICIVGMTMCTPDTCVRYSGGVPVRFVMHTPAPEGVAPASSKGEVIRGASLLLRLKALKGERETWCNFSLISRDRRKGRFKALCGAVLHGAIVTLGPA